MEPGETEKGFPLPTGVPPHEPEYQYTWSPLVALALSCEEPPWQIVEGVAVAEVGVPGLTGAFI